MKIIAFVCLLVCLIPELAAAEEWVLYDVPEADTKLLWKPSSVEKVSENIFRVWERIEETPEAKIESLKKRDSSITRQELIDMGYGDYAGSLKLWYMNCKTKQIALKSFVDYTKDIKEILSVQKMEDELQYIPVLPDTLTEILYMKVCP